MSEGAPTLTGKEKVADLSVEVFASLLVAVLHPRKSQGDARLMDMSVQEFTDTMLSFIKQKAYQGAAQEREVGERILADWAGLRTTLAVTAPFRVKTRDDVKGLTDSLLGMLRDDRKVELVVAVALVQADGSYRAVGV